MLMNERKVSNMTVTVEQIETKEFRVVNNGYDQEEVDNFLDDIMDTMDQQLAELQSLQQQLAAAKAAQATPSFRPVAPVTPAVDTNRAKTLEVLEMAQRLRDETLEKAQNEADALLADAKAEAAKHLGNLDEQKTHLENQIASLKQVAANYRERFESLLAAQQDAIEKASDLF